MQHVLTSIRRLLETTWPSAVVAIVTWISIVIAIDPAGSYPNMPEGPGLTVDEIFNVEQGVLLVEQAKALGWLNLVPGTSAEAFKPENHYLPDHPPLGRYWLGVHHHLTWWLFPPFDPEGLCVAACARTGSATAFALTVWLVGAFVALRRLGRESSDSRSGGRESPGFTRDSSSNSSSSTSLAESGDSRPPLREDQCRRWEGFFASLALVLMPRLYGHAHIASLETITNLTCTAAVLAVAHWWNGSAPPSCRVALLTGIVMGLALLTKIQAILIPIPVIAWALWRWRTKAILPLLIWGVTANVVFFALWPYLWLDPVGHYLEYLGRTTNRSTIHCFYFGVRYADKAVPWHYPFVMFAVTVPVGLHLLGAWGASSLFGRQPLFAFLTGGRKSPDSSSDSNVAPPPKAPLTLTLSPQSRGEGTRHSDILLLVCTVFPLIVFALPGVAVYDGERLFLTSFPLWAIFIGRGICKLMEMIVRRSNSRLMVAAVSVAFFSYHIAWQQSVRPGYLYYYNEATFGTAGAERLGLEIDYWGVGMTREFFSDLVNAVESAATVTVTPTLHQFQADDYRRQSPILRSRNITFIELRPQTLDSNPAIVFRRRADMPDRGNGPLACNVIAVAAPGDSDEKPLIWFAYATKPCGSPTRGLSTREDLRYP